MGRAHARHDVLALGVLQVLAVEPVLPGGRIASEADPRGGALAEVAEHHGLHADGGPDVVRNPVLLPVEDRAVVVPRAEHRVAGERELGERILRELLPGALLHHGLELGDQLAEVVGVEVLVGLGPLPALELREVLLEVVLLEAEHHRAEHLDEAPIAVPGEARIPGPERQALDGAVVEAEIEHGVHHAGHGEHRAGAHRHQQRILRVAEATAHDALEARERLALLRLEAGWQRALVRVVPAAHLGRDGEAGRHGHAGVRHLGEPGALAAEQRLHARVSFRCVVLAEEVDVLRGVRWLRAGCQRPGRCRHASFLLVGAGGRFGTGPPAPLNARGSAWPAVGSYLRSVRGRSGRRSYRAS